MIRHQLGDAAVVGMLVSDCRRVNWTALFNWVCGDALTNIN
jgi:hypothetical protein